MLLLTWLKSGITARRSLQSGLHEQNNFQDGLLGQYESRTVKLLFRLILHVQEVGFGFQVREQRVDFLPQPTAQAGANCAGLTEQQEMYTQNFQSHDAQNEVRNRELLNTSEIAGNRNQC